MIQFEKIEAVAKITFNRPDKYNSFVREMALEFQKKLDECSHDETVRCILAGAILALACDIVVAAKSASFIQALSKIGLIPDSGGTYFLPRFIGLPKAAAIMMTGESVIAEKAESLGMIYAVYEDSEFENSAMKLAKTIASMPTKGLGYTKILLSQTFNNSLDEQLSLEAEIQALSAPSEDHKEGIQAFLEKRTPQFTGK